MRRIIRPAALASTIFIAGCGAIERDARPKLLVLITLDQFRASYLSDYAEAFSGGFRRLREQGLRYDRAIVDHAPTLSFPGHTTVATGSHPRTHGFNANDWIETLPTGERRRVLVFRDTSEQTVGSPHETGLSTRKLQVTGLADWVRAAHPDARAVALSTGTGLAAVYAGRPLDERSRNHAYWLSERSGTFVTSTYFRSEVPDWIEGINDSVIRPLKADSVWRSTVPEAFRRLARDDASSCEFDGTHTTFPHRFSEVIESVGRPVTDLQREALHSRWFSTGPHGDEALFAAVRQAVQALALGQREVTDLLAIAVKSTDRQGHDFGPRSLEQLDILHRLDRLIGDFLEFLDHTVGPERYVVALTADHGAPNVAECEIEENRPGRRVTQDDVQDLLDRIAGFVRGFDGPEHELPGAIARQLEQSEFVARAMTPTELAGDGPADDILRVYRNAYVPGRNTTYPLWTDEVLYGAIGDAHPANWGVIVDLAEHAQIYTASSAHGSSHRYDREVPIILLGGGIRAGTATETARTVDLAPTLASLAGLAVPPHVDGVVLDLR